MAVSPWGGVMEKMGVYARSPKANLVGSKVISADATEMTIEMDKATTAIGRVVDQTGKPVPGVHVYCSLYGPNSPPELYGRIYISTETDKEGKYTMPALPVGFRGEISVSHFNAAKNLYEAFEGPKFVVKAGENRIADTILKPATPKANDQSGKTSAEKPAGEKKPAEAPTGTGQAFENWPKLGETKQLSQLKEQIGKQAAPASTLLSLGSNLSVDKNGIIWDRGKPIGIWGVNGDDMRSTGMNHR